jgi:ubiquinone/menaquinone biosynthesis C-methylase UbiE
MTKKTQAEKRKEAKKVFDKFIQLYDVADDLENDGKEKEGRDMKRILNIVGSFIIEQM